MPKPAIGPSRDCRRAWQHDDTRSPAATETDDDPQPSDLQHDEYRQPEWINHAVMPENDQANNPGRVQNHDERIMRRAEFDAAHPAQSPRIELRKAKFNEPLRKQKCHEPRALTHRT